MFPYFILRSSTLFCFARVDSALLGLAQIGSTRLNLVLLCFALFCFALLRSVPSYFALFRSTLSFFLVCFILSCFFYPLLTALLGSASIRFAPQHSAPKYFALFPRVSRFFTSLYFVSLCFTLFPSITFRTSVLSRQTLFQKQNLQKSNRNAIQIYFTYLFNYSLVIC